MRGKICVVTGGSRGIGLMIASVRGERSQSLRFFEKKDACDLVARELTNLGPGTAVSMPADISSDAGCKELAENCKTREENRCSREQRRCYLGISIRDLSRDGMGKSDDTQCGECL